MTDAREKTTARTIRMSGSSETAVSEWAHALQAALGPEQCTVLDCARYCAGPGTPLTEDAAARLCRDLMRLREGRITACPAHIRVSDAEQRLCDALHPAPLLVVLGPMTGPVPVGPAAEIDEQWWLGPPPSEAVHRHVGSDTPLSALMEMGLDWVAEYGLDVHRHRAAGSLGPDFFALAGRMGLDKLGQRLERQANHWAGLDHQGEGLFFFERWIPMDRVIRLVLDGVGLGRMGRRGARRLVVERNSVTHPGLPAALDGFTLLQLSDLHLDLETGVGDVLLSALPDLDYDVVVITGDYRNSTRDNYAYSIERTKDILDTLRPPVIGILGNHDFIEMAPVLEANGLRVLLNEGVFIERGDARVLIAGIDDPHYYQTHDMRCAGRMPAADGLFRILLSHSPEIWREAAQDYDLMLCGHTHGGQICLPGGVALVRNGRCPGRMLAGAWREGRLQGYTSRGTGCCGVPMRFFCPPEITLHTLRAH